MTADTKNDPRATSRSIDLSVDLDAPVDVVWRALTDPAELVRWFPTDASIDPRPGGAFTISWEGQWQWDMTVTDVEPLRRLRMIDHRARPFDADGRPVAAAAVATLALEITLEALGDKTRRRLVHSGFGSGSTWDDEIDGVHLGWNVELRGLRQYLTHHRGRARQIGWVHVSTRAALAAVWSRLVDERMIVTSALPAALREGDRCTLTLATGDRIEGPVVFYVPGRQLVIAAETLGDGLFRLSLDRAAGDVMVQIWISSWTRPAEETAALAARLRIVLDRALAQM